MVKDLNIRTKTIKLLEENIGVNHHDLGFGKGFLDMTLKAWVIKGKKKLDFTKVKNLFALKDTIKKSENMTHRIRENICNLYIW